MKKILFVLMFVSAAFLGKAQSIEEGIKQMENENFAAALNIFNSICKADPKASQAHFYIGEVNYLMENYDEAEKSYRRGLTANPQCAECTVGLGKLELDKGNPAEAEKYFSSALKMNKKSALIPALIGDAYLYSKKPDAAKAVKYLSDARDADPRIAKYWAHLGDAYRMSGDNGEAMTSYEAAVSKDPTNTEAYISMARIWANAKQVELAIPKLEEAMRLAPNDARPIKDLYELYIQKRDYAKVIPLLEKYVSLIGSDVDAKVRLVKFLTFQAKDYERAIAEGEKLLFSNPEQYTLHRWLAWSYTGIAKQMEADKLANKTLTDEAKKAADSLIVKNYCKALGESEKLFEAIEKDVDKRKAFPEDYDIWALSSLRCGDIDKAAHIYRKYIEFEPTKASDIYGVLAKTYFDSTNYEQAISYYMKKKELKPLSNADEYYLGLSEYYTHHYVEADTAVTHVVQATPTYVPGWLMKARAEIHIDSLNTTFLAKPSYEKYIELAVVDKEKNKKGLIEAYGYLGAYYAQKEDNQKAKEYFALILELDPANENAQKSLEILKSIPRR
jgi:tetratricopeptide (TPR) repeat protein